MSDKFFTQNRCDRCFKPLRDGRTMSWFTEETICLDCSKSEDETKKEIKESGGNPSDYEGCGHVPIPKRREDAE